MPFVIPAFAAGGAAQVIHDPARGRVEPPDPDEEIKLVEEATEPTQ